MFTRSAVTRYGTIASLGHRRRKDERPPPVARRAHRRTSKCSRRCHHGSAIASSYAAGTCHDGRRRHRDPAGRRMTAIPRNRRTRPASTGPTTPMRTERGMPRRSGGGGAEPEEGEHHRQQQVLHHVPGEHPLRGRIERRGDRDQQQDPADDEACRPPGRQVRREADRTGSQAATSHEVERHRDQDATTVPGEAARADTHGCMASGINGPGDDVVDGRDVAGRLRSSAGDLGGTGVVGQGDQNATRAWSRRREVLPVDGMLPPPCWICRTIWSQLSRVPTSSRAGPRRPPSPPIEWQFRHWANWSWSRPGVRAVSDPSRSRPASDRRSRPHADSRGRLAQPGQDREGGDHHHEADDGERSTRRRPLTGRRDEGQRGEQRDDHRRPDQQEERLRGG